MPASTTITAFYTFTANTKARASEINNNFSNFRGHLIPIDPNTQTASDNSYDLGSASWRWKDIYFAGSSYGDDYFGNSFAIYGSTTTSNSLIQNGGSDLQVLIGSVTSAVFTASGLSGNHLIDGSVTKNKIAATGDYVFSGSSGSVAATGSSGIQTLTAMNITITTYGRPVCIAVSGSLDQTMLSLGSSIISSTFRIYRSSTQIDSATYSQTLYTSTTFILNESISYPLNQVFFDAPSAGTHSYRFAIVNSFNWTRSRVNGCVATIYEL
jgi:hypothetical protein